MAETMPDPEQESRLTRQQRIQTRRLNEQYKLGAGALDRLSTVILGGAVLAPIFQKNIGGWPEAAAWVAAALFLHATAHFVLRLIKEEP